MSSPEQASVLVGPGRAVAGRPHPQRGSADEFASVCQELPAYPVTLAALRRSGHAYLVAEHSMKPFRERPAVVID